jgi:hypothetical protein
MPTTVALVEATGLSLVAVAALRRMAAGPLARMFPRVWAALVGGLATWVGVVWALAWSFAAARSHGARAGSGWPLGR